MIIIHVLITIRLDIFVY
uniref:Uncharacterized protein n=1 Tax=Rhizophora mucronata TaxID=61149 RepID=A0A2P2MK05_RHIMU